MGHADLRKGRESIPAQVYLITCVTYQRKPLFSDWLAGRLLSQILESTTSISRSKILAWVVMPDHLHVLVELSAQDSLGKFTARLKGTATRKLHAAGLCSGPIWVDAFHDRAIRNEEDLLPAARYIVANPIRAGLVRRAGDYPFWNAIWL